MCTCMCRDIDMYILLIYTQGVCVHTQLEFQPPFSTPPPPSLPATHPPQQSEAPYRTASRLLFSLPLPLSRPACLCLCQNACLLVLFLLLQLGDEPFPVPEGKVEDQSMRRAGGAYTSISSSTATTVNILAQH